MRKLTDEVLKTCKRKVIINVQDKEKREAVYRFLRERKITYCDGVDCAYYDSIAKYLIINCEGWLVRFYLTYSETGECIKRDKIEEVDIVGVNLFETEE